MRQPLSAAVVRCLDLFHLHKVIPVVVSTVCCVIAEALSVVISLLIRSIPKIHLVVVGISGIIRVWAHLACSKGRIGAEDCAGYHFPVPHSIRRLCVDTKVDRGIEIASINLDSFGQAQRVIERTACVHFDGLVQGCNNVTRTVWSR